MVLTLPQLFNLNNQILEQQRYRFEADSTVKVQSVAIKKQESTINKQADMLLNLSQQNSNLEDINTINKKRYRRRFIGGIGGGLVTGLLIGVVLTTK